MDFVWDVEVARCPPRVQDMLAGSPEASVRWMLAISTGPFISAQAGVPWAEFRVTGHVCKLSVPKRAPSLLVLNLLAVLTLLQL